VWFTAGGAPGVYFTSTEDQGRTFSMRSKISDKAMHPQMAALPDDRLVLVWDEMQAETPEPVHAGMHQGGGHASAVGGSKVVLQIRKGTTAVKSVDLSSPGANASYPVLSMVEGKSLVAWSQETDEGAAIYYRWLPLDE